MYIHNSMAFTTRSKYVTVILHILIWCAVFSLPFFLGTPGEQYDQIGPMPVPFFTFSNILHLVLFYSNIFYLYPRLFNRKKWGFYAMTVIVLLLLANALKLFILDNSFPAVPVNAFTGRFIFMPTAFFLVISFIYCRVQHKLEYERKLREREAGQLALELKFLRSQISPHFLFNVLNSLVAMARYKSTLLEPSLIRLSELMRYMLYESNENKVPLSREISYLKSYIELQKIRFEDSISIQTEIEDADDSLSIEPMLLIPFVENAFRHGVVMVDDPFIQVILRVAGKTLYFSVENKFIADGVSQSKDKDSGIGLANVRTRLNLLYPDEHRLTVNNGNNIFKITLTLTLK